MSFQEDRRRAAHRAGLGANQASRKGIWTIDEFGTEYMQTPVVGSASATIPLNFTPRDLLAGKTYAYELKLVVKNGSVSSSAAVLGFQTFNSPTVSEHTRAAGLFKTAGLGNLALTDASLSTAGNATALAGANGVSSVLINGMFVCTAPGQIVPQIVTDANGANLTILAGSSFTMKAIN